MAVFKFYDGSSSTWIELAQSSDIPTESTVSGWGFTKNTGNVTGSSLTSGYFVLGANNSAISISSMKPTTSSTSWSTSSDVNVPTMKAISSYVTGLNYITSASVGNGTLTIKAAGTSKGTFTANQSGNTEINITAADLGVGDALHFIGTSSTAITDGGTENPTISGYSGTAKTTGNVVLYDGKEYVWTGSAWEQLGDEGSWALKTVSITGTGALGGGGTLASNRTITHSELNTSGAKSTAAVYKVTLDKYGHVLSAVSASASDVGALSTSATLDNVADGSTRKLANYLPLTGGTLSGDLSISTSTSVAKKVIVNQPSGMSGDQGSAYAALTTTAVNNGSEGSLELSDYMGTATKYRPTKIILQSGYSLLFPSISADATLATQGWVEGKGYVTSSGVTSVTIQTSGTGISVNSTSAITSTGTRTITLDSSSAGNAAANKVVLRNATGSIQSEKFAVSSGSTTKATMQYNTTDDCIEFVFA